MLSQRYTDRSAASALRSSSRLVLLPSPHGNASSESLPSYVPLPMAKRRATDAEDTYRSILAPERDDDEDDGLAGSGDEEAEDPLAKGVFGDLKQSDEDEDAEEDDVEAESTESLVRNRNIEFSRRLAADPSDVDGWLAWAKFSSETGFSDRPSSPGPSSKATPAVTASLFSRSTIVLAHLDRALSSHPAILETNPRFMLALMQAAVEVESTVKVEARWEKLLAGPLGVQLEVWRAWGDYKMSSRGKGADDACAGWAEEGLARLQAQAEGQPPSSACPASRSPNHPSHTSSVCTVQCVRTSRASRSTSCCERA